MNLSAQSRTSSRSILMCVALLPTLVFATGCHNVSPELEREASISTTQWIDHKFGFITDPDTVTLVRRVTERLAGAIKGSALEEDLDRDDASDYATFPWQAFIVNSKQPNAFSSGAGVIFITKGLVAGLNSESELAAIIGHEMAHQLLGHTRQAMLNGASRDKPRFVFTLEHEIEADTLGAKILTVAGYNPRGALSAISDSTRDRINAGQKVDESWVTERMANLESVVREHVADLPSTETSREFTHIRDRIVRGEI